MLPTRALPQGAKRIWQMRVNRMKPDDMVLVSVIGPLKSEWVVEVGLNDKFEQMEWRWLTNLSVCLVFDETCDRKRLFELAKHMLRHAPNGGYTKFDMSFGHLWMWNAATQKATLLNWWKGYEGIPELGIPSQPETVDAENVPSRYWPALEGV